VRAGQPLVRLASPELGELQLKLMEAASQSQLATRTLQRERQLLAEGIIAQRRVQEAEANAAQQHARYQQAQAALRMAGVDAGAIARIAAGGSAESSVTLRARSAGIVSKLDVKPGQRVQAADPVAHIADTSRLWLEVQLPAALPAGGNSLRGQTVSVVGRDVTASAQSVNPMVTDSQTMNLRAEVTRGAALLRPGEFVQVRLPMPAAQGFAVPLASVVRQGDKPYVFVRTAKGFVAKPVTVLASAGQNVRVAGELKAGDEVATTSVIALKAAWQGKGGGS
jgi:membrane fusion protein, heavy metal efflux system